MNKNIKKKAKLLHPKKDEKHVVKLVQVKWADAGGALGWTSPDKFEDFCTNDILVHTVGYMMYLSDQYIVLTQNISGDSADGGLGNLMKIPISTIRGIKYLGKYEHDFFQMEISKTTKRSK